MELIHIATVLLDDSIHLPKSIISALFKLFDWGVVASEGDFGCGASSTQIRLIAVNKFIQQVASVVPLARDYRRGTACLRPSTQETHQLVVNGVKFV